MTANGEARDRFVADPVDDQAEEDNAQSERPHACAVDGAFLVFREIEAVLEQTDGICSNAKNEGGGDEGDETRPEQFHVGPARGRIRGVHDENGKLQRYPTFLAIAFLRQIKNRPQFMRTV